MATGTRPGYADIIHTGRDSIVFPPVYNTDDGKPPVAGKDGKVPEVESFTLRLGSTDDEAAALHDDSVLGPRQAVPNWALAHLRKQPVFKHYESPEIGKVRVFRAA